MPFVDPSFPFTPKFAQLDCTPSPQEAEAEFPQTGATLTPLLYEAHAFRGDPGAAGSWRGQLPGARPPHAFLRRPVTRALRRSLHLALSSTGGRHGSITTTGTESLCGCGDTACLMEKGMARGDVTAGLRPGTQHGAGARVGSADSGFGPSVTKPETLPQTNLPSTPLTLNHAAWFTSLGIYQDQRSGSPLVPRQLSVPLQTESPGERSPGVCLTAVFSASGTVPGTEKGPGIYRPGREGW